MLARARALMLLLPPARHAYALHAASMRRDDADASPSPGTLRVPAILIY